MEDAVTIFVDNEELTEADLEEEDICPEEYINDEWWLIRHENKGI